MPLFSPSLNPTATEELCGVYICLFLSIDQRLTQSICKNMQPTCTGKTHHDLKT